MKSFLTIATGILALTFLLSFSVLATPKVSSSKQDKAAEQTANKESPSDDLTTSGTVDENRGDDVNQPGPPRTRQSGSGVGQSYSFRPLDTEPPIQSDDPEPIPEPGTLILMSAGLVAVGAGVRRRWKGRTKA